MSCEFWPRNPGTHAIQPEEMTWAAFLVSAKWKGGFFAALILRNFISWFSLFYVVMFSKKWWTAAPTQCHTENRHLLCIPPVRVIMEMAEGCFSGLCPVTQDTLTCWAAGMWWSVWWGVLGLSCLTAQQHQHDIYVILQSKKWFYKTEHISSS